jgi:hypothetical protein
VTFPKAVRSTPGLAEALCANMTETSCVTAISEQGGRERTQNGIGKRLGSSGRSVSNSRGFGNG